MDSKTEPRIERGRAIAASKRLREAPDGTWIVLSQTRPMVKYAVDLKSARCTCPDFETWELDCKHIYGVRFFQNPNQIEIAHEDPMPRRQYPQDWGAYNAAQIREKEHFLLLLKGLCEGLPQPKRSNGRPPLALSDVVYAAVTKVYTTVSGRRASTDLRECMSKGHVRNAPHHNSISHYLCMEALTPILKKLVEQSAAPLKAIESQFAVDATGFSTSVYDRWFDHKYGAAEGTRRQRWIKCHAMVGTITNVITSVEITESYVNDTTMLPDLVAATCKQFDVREVSADKGYLSNQNLLTIEAFGAQGFIPFKVDSQGKGTTPWEKLWHLFWFKRDEFLKSYHRRSNVETTFSMIKRKFGGCVRSKDFTAQTNEVLCKVLAHNIVVLVHEMYELGITPDFWNGPHVTLQ